ncbi:PDZ domain-containing protein 11-like [Acanthaster planci]|uniref:PDZ domain-containing protein 11-like n=1 Tax=Acanthaster planci TaxID=133434 RepID=A0A8B7YGH2_ACAPL|nr:PDZ domain-containing protein 11-like [Acanthaster planci]
MKRHQIPVELPAYDYPPQWVPPEERIGHADYDNNLTQFLLRSVRFTRNRHTGQLGFNIRGGKEHRCGIYVSRVIPESSAFRVGMKRGDLVLSVNGTDFTNITHDEAVKILKSVKEIEIKLKYSPFGYNKTYERVESPQHHPYNER